MNLRDLSERDLEKLSRGDLQRPAREELRRRRRQEREREERSREQKESRDQRRFLRGIDGDELAMIATAPGIDDSATSPQGEVLKRFIGPALDAGFSGIPEFKEAAEEELERRRRQRDQRQAEQQSGGGKRTWLDLNKLFK